MDQYRMYKRRWFGMGAIIILNIATAFVWLTFNTVSKTSEDWLNASLSEVNLTSMLYFAGSVVSGFGSGAVFEKWGIKVALIVGGVLNIVGCWLRYFASFIDSSPESHEARLAVIYLGQFIAATAQPFFLNAPPKYSALWFGDSSRAIATTIGTVSNPLGIAIAMLAIPEMIKMNDPMPQTLMLIGVISVVSIIPAFFMPVAPPTPPSPSAEIAIAEASDEGFVTALMKVSRNTQFWLLFAMFSISVAVFNSLTSLINQIVTPYGYSDDDAGLFGACFILAGFVGAILSGIFLDRTKRYNEVLKTAAPLLAVGYVGFTFVVRENFFPYICILCGFLGFVSFALLPVALELGVECTHPCPPSTSTVVLWFGGQTLGVIFLIAGDQLRDKSPFKDEPEDTMRLALICVAAISIATSCVALAFNTPYKRLEAEREKMKQQHDEKEKEDLS